MGIRPNNLWAADSMWTPLGVVVHWKDLFVRDRFFTLVDFGKTLDSNGNLVSNAPSSIALGF